MSIGNYLSIASVFLAYHECYHFNNDSFIFLGAASLFSVSMLFINSKIRKSCHVTQIANDDIRELMAEFKTRFLAYTAERSNREQGTF